MNVIPHIWMQQNLFHERIEADLIHFLHLRQDAFNGSTPGDKPVGPLFSLTLFQIVQAIFESLSFMLGLLQLGFRRSDFPPELFNNAFLFDNSTS